VLRTWSQPRRVDETARSAVRRRAWKAATNSDLAAPERAASGVLGDRIAEGEQRTSLAVL
jgi:hypothetical protein